MSKTLKLFLRLFILLFSLEITLASHKTLTLNPSTSERDDTEVSSPDIYNTQKVSNTRGARALWNPRRIFTPFFGRLIEGILRVTSGSLRSRSNNRKVDDEHEYEQPQRAPPPGEALNMHKVMESFGFTKRARDHRKEICGELGGVLINGECTQYFGRDFRRSFEDARAFCRSKGGDLWTPNLRDPFLYHKLMKYIPQIAGAKGEDLWLGVVQYNARAFTITGEDVTDAYLIQIYDGNYIDGQCYILDFPNGQFSAKDIDCRTHQEFICEYPLTTGNEIHNNW
ncbi:UNVERIFIED_CONTAM: hypothetical protein RMT77_001518 [Armadillidium vulgare]